MRLNIEISRYAYEMAKESAEINKTTPEDIIENVLYEWANTIRKYGKPLKVEYVRGMVSEDEREAFLKMMEDKRNNTPELTDEDIANAFKEDEELLNQNKKSNDFEDFHWGDE